MNNSLQVHEETASNYFHRGNLLKQSDKLEEAAAAYQRCTELNPDFSWYHHNLGEVLAKLGQRDGAEKSYRRACELNPNSAWSWHNFGEVLQQQGNLDEAVAAYRKAVELYPDFYEFYNSLGQALCLQGQLDESVSCLRKAIELDSESALPYQNLWEALARLGRVDEGIDCLRRAIELNPGEGDLYLKLAEALQGKNELAEAVNYYRKALQLKPDFHWLYYKLGTALSAQGQWEEAIASYSKAAELEPGSAIVHHYLGHTLSIVQRWEEAIVSYRKAIALAPDVATVYFHLGDALATRQRWHESVAEYRKAVEIEPNSLESQDHLGFALAQLQQWDEAIAAYRKALKIAPDSEVVYHHLADALAGRSRVQLLQKEAESDLDEAVSCYRKAIEFNPNNLELCKKMLEIKPDDLDLYLPLGDAFARQKAWKEAIASYNHAVDLDPENAEACHKLGEALQTQGQLDEAVAAYMKAIKLNPNFFGTYHNLADILRPQGQFDEAVLSYQKSIELNPNFVWSYHNLAELFDKQGKLDEAATWYRQAIAVDQGFAWSHYNLGKILAKQNKLSESIESYQKAIEIEPKLFSEDYQSLRDILPDNQDTYSKWRAKNCPREADLRKMAEMVEIFSYKPLISVVMPVFNTPEKFLREAIESVLNQIYPYWELCIADDASTETHVKQILSEYVAKDNRIKVFFRRENGHISHCSNSALELAGGEFVSLLDHDDTLAPDVLYEVALLLNRHPDADMIYSDEDKLNPNNQLIDPYFKPEWCPESFLSRMYTCHLGTYRRSLVNEIGGFRAGYEGSQDYDLVLRLTEKTDKIFHIPKILYHWRIHSNSVTGGGEAKPYAYEAAKKAIVEAISRKGEEAKVIDVPELLGHYMVRYKITEYKLVSIIIPTRDLGEILDNCLESIFTKSIYPNYEVIVIDNGSTEEKTAQLIAKWTAKESNRFRCYRLDIPFNFSRINNYAVKQARGDYLLFLNNDTEVIATDWIDGMVEQAQKPAIGAVGALLLYPDNTIQHAGIVMGLGGLAAHSHYCFPATTPGYLGQVKCMSNVSAVTGACLMCRREVFEAIGGFDEELVVAYNDVDLCLKMVATGYRNVYLPHVVLYHHESKSRGYEDTPQKQDRLRREANVIKSRWQKFIDNDPCYSPNLTRERADYSIRL
ncbi:tetratricopeptide repeat protein [Microcoleus sp. N9_A1]|uniref:tetratricopeptide repeat protein n=1 Tax=Microcoleus sp. N9_A1 TaxID=3055380 RepID=UPI002FD3EE42